MRRDPTPWAESGAARVVHLVGAVDEAARRFLAPATHALAQAGVEQSLVLVDHLASRHHLTAFHEQAELVLSPALASAPARWRALLRTFAQVVHGMRPRAVHLHGLLACAAGPLALRATGQAPRLCYSLHGVGLASLLLAARARSAGAGPAPGERAAPLALLGQPVDTVFFETPRHEARHPLVVTGSRGLQVRGSETFAQLAVLIGGSDLRIAFNWVGPADPVSRLRLKAAQVGVFDPAHDAIRASRLAAGWVYVAGAGGRGFPLELVEAMALGLPCVALDNARHREVLQHGETGLLFASQAQLLDRVAELIDSTVLRAALGQRARAAALARFGERRFRERLLAAYEMA
jgi:hypothetical protein